MCLTAIVAGVAASAYGSYSKAKAAKSQAEFNQRQAKYNSRVAEQNAEEIEAAGRDAIYVHRLAVGRSIGTARAQSAAAGLVVGEAGTTPQDIVQSMIAAGELDVMRIKRNIEQQKRAALTQAQSFSMQANQYGKTAGSINPLVSGLLTGVGGVSANQDILFP